MKSAQPKLPKMEPRIPESVKPKRSTTKTEDRARMEAIDNLLKQVLVEARSFRRPAPLKQALKNVETL
jgi:hypothetical protein